MTLGYLIIMIPTSDLSYKCRSIMNKLESVNIYLEIYKENVF